MIELIYKNWVTRDIAQAYPTWVFLFGDNCQRVGLGGQAKELRGEPNAVGIATKWSPSKDLQAYFTDEDFEVIIPIINLDCAKAVKLAKSLENVIVIPPLGVGLAQLPIRAPKVYDYLQQKLDGLANE